MPCEPHGVHVKESQVGARHTHTEVSEVGIIVKDVKCVCIARDMVETQLIRIYQRIQSAHKKDADIGTESVNPNTLLRPHKSRHHIFRTLCAHAFRDEVRRDD